MSLTLRWSGSVSLLPEWQELFRSIPDRRTREGLSRASRFWSINQITPEQVDATPADGGGNIEFAATIDGSSLRIAVLDEGPGLGSAALDVLGGRADRLPRQAATGSGLGL